VILIAGQQAVPVERSEERPHGHSYQVDAVFPFEITSRRPNLPQPAQLLLVGAVNVRFGNGHCSPESIPGLAEQGSRPGDSLGNHADRLDVSVSSSAVAAMRMDWIPFDSVVKEPLASDVVIEAEYIRGARFLREAEEGFRITPILDQVVPEGVLHSHLTSEQIECQPPALIFELGLVNQFWRTEGLSQILGLDQLRIGIHLTDPLHRE
jgi:hypothetical protein